jgi:glutamate synthase domain-containing protein 3
MRKQRTKSVAINAEGIHYKLLNEKIHNAIKKGYKKIILENVCGQRYIGDGLESEDVEIIINGVPGNDLASFMDGPRIVVNSNAQDGVGNTMNAGKVIIYGDAGDITGLSMRGGKIYIKGNVGYRVGIHMKAYKNLFPVVIVGGTAKDFLGEYMAGGLLVILGLNASMHSPVHASTEVVGDFVGTGMHGGSIFIRGRVDERRLGKEVKITKPNNEDMELLKKYLSEYCSYFKFNLNKIFKEPFIKLYPYTHRPYGKLYAY